MLQNYYTIAQDGQHEIVIKKSQFICTLKRIESEEQAKDFIQAIKKEHWKAHHNCSAYVLGDNQAIQRSSDDGEPSGTAGIPMLEVLKVKELKDCLAVVTRYFGGVKLGSGGLIRAYSQSVSEALEAIGIVECTLQQALHVPTDYSSHGKVSYFLETHPEYTLKDTIFTDSVELIIMANIVDIDKLTTELTNLLSGQVTFKTGDQSYVERLLDQSKSSL